MKIEESHLSTPRSIPVRGGGTYDVSLRCHVQNLHTSLRDVRERRLLGTRRFEPLGKCLGEVVGVVRSNIRISLSLDSEISLSRL